MLNRIFKNRKGSAYLLIYGFVFLFFIGVLYITFNQTVQNEFHDILYESGLNFSDEDKAEAERFNGFWKIMPYFLPFVVLLFWFVHIGITRGDGE